MDIWGHILMHQQGSAGKDMAIWLFCGCCALAQEAKQVLGVQGSRPHHQRPNVVVGGFTDNNQLSGVAGTQYPQELQMQPLPRQGPQQPLAPPTSI